MTKTPTNKSSYSPQAVRFASGQCWLVAYMIIILLLALPHMYTVTNKNQEANAQGLLCKSTSLVFSQRNDIIYLYHV